MSAYYNEHDPFAAAWLRELMADGLIAPGVVDERSIEDVRPDELAGFAQCHFFAGIGVWSLALREAGWPDDRPIWTGSCPCQPFSAAGKGAGFADERHLWPAFHWLVEQVGPELVLGEQVASKDGLAWLDLVQADLEGSGYAFGAVDTCAAGFGAPHIRQRLYWMAHAMPAGRAEGRSFAGDRSVAGSDRFGGLAHALRDGAWNAPGQGVGAQAAANGSVGDIRGQRLRAGIEGAAIGVADAQGARGWSDAGAICGRSGSRIRSAQGADDGRPCLEAGWAGDCGTVNRPSPTNGLWRAADWLLCTDGKLRPVEPGTFPLADAGTFRNRVAELRGAGNAITLAQAQGFIDAVADHLASAPRLEQAA